MRSKGCTLSVLLVLSVGKITKAVICAIDSFSTALWSSRKFVTTIVCRTKQFSSLLHGQCKGRMTNEVALEGHLDGLTHLP
jgi:hypothetical protein